MDPDLFLTSDTGKALYKAVKALPIIDYHNHLPVAEIARDTRFTDVNALYHLDQKNTGSIEKSELGPLPNTALTLLIVLAVVWVLIGVWAYFNFLRRKKS